MSNKANQESICTNGTLNILQSPQGAENRAGTQTLVDTSAEQKGRDLYIQAESCHDRAAPPAEQKATKETSGGFHVWRDISTAPKDGSRFVATGHNYGLYSEVRHTCVAQWFRGCWMEASDWNETSELKYLTHWMPLPSPPDDVAAPAEQQAAPKAAPGPVSDTQHSQFLSDVLTAAGLITHGKQCKALGARLSDMVMRLRAAPQQEAQEPALFVSAKQLADLADPSHATAGGYLPARKTRAGLFTLALYTAPQPASAPLSDDVVKDAARWRMAALIGNELMLDPGKSTHATAVKAYMDATGNGSDLTGAVDAALAAQGGKA